MPYIETHEAEHQNKNSNLTRLGLAFKNRGQQRSQHRTANAFIYVHAHPRILCSHENNV